MKPAAYLPEHIYVDRRMKDIGVGERIGQPTPPYLRRQCGQRHADDGACHDGSAEEC